MFAIVVSALLSCVGAYAAQPQASPISHHEGAEDPLWAPPELIAFVKSRVLMFESERGRAEALLRLLVLPEHVGGLGIEYSNDKTRTINEVWLDRKANCVSLTFMYVALAKQLRINAVFAESIEAINWSRVGGVIRMEKHMVAVIHQHPGTDLVADFLPQTRTRYGNYFVNIITTARARSVYYSNSAVEAFIANDKETAAERIQMALEADPTSYQAWNIKGVIEKSYGKTLDAMRSYSNAIRCNPNNVVAIGNLAGLYRSEGFFEEAAKLRAIENNLRRRDPYYLAFLASEALENNNFREAEKLLKRAIKIHPADANFYITLSHIYGAQNKMSQAVDALAKARSYATPDKIADLDLLLQGFSASMIPK